MKPEQSQQAIDAISRTLEEPPVSIEQALQEAVAAKRMTPDEAIECFDAYRKSLGGAGE